MSGKPSAGIPRATASARKICEACIKTRSVARLRHRRATPRVYCWVLANCRDLGSQTLRARGVAGEWLGRSLTIEDLGIASRASGARFRKVPKTSDWLRPFKMEGKVT